MNTRIRYNLTSAGLHVSTRAFEAGGRSFLVSLDKAAMKFAVLDAATQAVVSEGSGTKNFSVLKIKAKDALVALGVSFAAEARVKASVPVVTESAS